MRKIIINILVSMISLLIVAGVIEVVLRAFSPIYMAGYIGAYKYDKTLGVRLKYNIHSIKTTDYQQEVYTNQIGTVNLQDSFADYDKLTFAIGDSYTQGTGLPIDASYPFQLSMMLNMENDQYKTKNAVINLGLAAFGAEQAILSLQMYSKILSTPDYILYLGCWNDYADDILFENGYRHKHLVEGNPHWGNMLGPIQWLTNETEIGKRIKIFAATLKRKSHMKHDGDKKQNGNSAAKKHASNGIVSVAEKQAERLEKLLAISRKMNARLIVSWTDLPQSASGSYSWLKQWAERNNVAFADWHPGFESMQGAIPKIPIRNQHSGGHYRTWVNNVIAKSFAEQIKN
jgi:lysophospholipase L1-like esterase